MRKENWNLVKPELEKGGKRERDRKKDKNNLRKKKSLDVLETRYFVLIFDLIVFTLGP